MNDLEECRAEIDSIDSQIVELYEKRMEVIKRIVKYKLENNMPVTDYSRETLMYEKNLKKVKSDTMKAYYKDVLNGFLKASKDLQKDLLDELSKNYF